MKFNRIVLLAGKWETTPIVYNFLRQHFHVEKAIVEERVPRKQFLKKRAKKLGIINVTGQVLFQLIIAKPLAKLSQKRIQAIKTGYKLSGSAIPAEQVVNLPSVNAPQCLDQLKDLQPDLVIVHGTRIISKRILQSVNSIFINIHAGITPRYRGSHGAYWALVNNDKENCGVTVHLVDTGIDTGNILAQAKIPYTREDNFVTYPYLQLAEGLKLLKEVVEKLQREERPEVNNGLDSALWHHPTLWGYLWKRLRKGVK